MIPHSRRYRASVLAALLVLTCAPSAFARSGAPSARTLQARVRRALKEHAPRLGSTAEVAVHVRDVSDDSVLVEMGPERAFNLASTVKVLTAAGALEKLGVDSRFVTRVLAWGRKEGAVDTLALVGGGDPTLTAEDLDGLAAGVAKAGVKAVGALIVVPEPFGPARFPPAYDQKQTHAAYRAPVGGLNLDHNRVRARLRPGAAVGQAVVVELRPPARDVAIVNQATTERGKRERLTVDVRWPDTGPPEVVIGGSIGVRRKGGVTGVRLNAHPERWAAWSFRDALGRAGVRVSDSAPAVSETLPDGGDDIASHQSAPLLEVVRDMLRHSDNQVAETLLLWLGHKSGATGAAGAAKLAGWLSSVAGRPTGAPTELRIHNGSGLYGGTFASAPAMTAILASIHRRPTAGGPLRSSLGQPGQPGTLRGRLRDLPTGTVRAKTGTLDEVSNLCGYLDGPHRTVAFCVFCDGLTKRKVSAARRLQDAVVRALMGVTEARSGKGGGRKQRSARRGR